MLYLISTVIFLVVVLIMELVKKTLPKRINTYSHNGILHAYNDVWFYNGDGGDSYPDVYAKGRNIVELYLNIIWNEIRWVIFYKWEYRIMRSISDTTKVWWYNQLIQTECDSFIYLGKGIEKHINWNKVDWGMFQHHVI